MHTTAAMIGIGMNFEGAGDPQAEIEPTLLMASKLGMDGDFRVLGVLTSWLFVHAAYVHVERLRRLVVAGASARALCYWAAVAAAFEKDRRYRRLASAYSGDPVELIPETNAFYVTRHGLDPRFFGSCLIAPAGVLRDRPQDVLTPEKLAARHLGYKNRLMMGPAWRADLWTALTQAPELSAAALARKTGCGYATAWRAVEDFAVCQRAAALREDWQAAAQG